MRRLLLTVVLVSALGAATAAGYAVGRNGFVVPAWVPAPLSSTLAGVIPARPTPSSGAPPADLQDYEFRLVDQNAKQGEAVVAVQLVHKPTGKPVPDGVIFARRIDMAPDGMASMTAPLEPVPGGTPGTYRFRTNLMMAGGWQISLAAKVPGEVGTVQSRLVLKAVP